MFRIGFKIIRFENEWIIFKTNDLFSKRMISFQGGADPVMWISQSSCKRWNMIVGVVTVCSASIVMYIYVFMYTNLLVPMHIYVYIWMCMPACICVCMCAHMHSYSTYRHYTYISSWNGGTGIVRVVLLLSASVLMYINIPRTRFYDAFFSTCGSICDVNLTIFMQTLTYDRGSSYECSASIVM